MLAFIARNANNAILSLVVLVLVIAHLAYPNDYDGAPARDTKRLPEWERQMLARTLLGECGRCGDEEVRWIAHVIFNRLRSGEYGEEIGDVVMYQRRGVYHFATWDPRQNKREAIGAHVDRSAAFARMLRLGDAAWEEVDDPTAGAVNFYHPAAMKPRGRVPNWAKDRIGTRVGGAVFFR